MQFLDMMFYNGKVLMLPTQALNSTISIIEKEGATDFVDVNAQPSGGTSFGYYYETISAPVSDGRAFVQKGEGVDVIMQSDLYNETDHNLIKDFGVLTTESQKIPDQGTGLQKPFINIGIEGSYIQHKISGTTTTGKSVGLTIYGTNFWRELGNSPR